MKANLIHMYDGFKGHIPDEAIYEGLKIGRYTFKRPLEEIKEFLVHGPTFLRLMALDTKKKVLPVYDSDELFGGNRYICPECRNFITFSSIMDSPEYCSRCGQHLDWEVK